MRFCKQCGDPIPNSKKIAGKKRNLRSRKYCLKCSPFMEKRGRRSFKQDAVNYCGGCCVLCGYDKCLSALTFHHVDPSSKSFGISVKGHLVSWERAKKELEKCVLLCKNCHTEIEEKVSKLPDGIKVGKRKRS